jgi:8-amino-7-oxononanoate synthase
MSLFGKCYRFTKAREIMAAGYYPYFAPIESSDDTEVVIRGERKLMFGSNNYLGLTHHPKVIEAAEQALRRFGSGCTGSRFLNGTLDLHEVAEERFARFLNQDAALVFSTGFQTNLGVLSALVGREDHVFSDKLNHASIVDGTRLCFGTVHRYPHADLRSLERELARTPSEAGKLIVTDGIFSMEGTIVDLPSVMALAEFYGAEVLVDDAHSFGVLGAHGGGTAQHFQMEDRVSLIMATFSKSLASIGGVVAGPEDVIHFLKHNARSLIFSASTPAASIAAAVAALEVIESEPELREQLWRNTRHMQEGLKNLGYDIGGSETPIVPVAIGEMERMLVFWKELFDGGIFTNPVTPPAVPENSCRIRISLMATHTADQIDTVLDAFASAGKKMAVI